MMKWWEMVSGTLVLFALLVVILAAIALIQKQTEPEKPVGRVDELISYDLEFLKRGSCLVVMDNITRNIAQCPIDVYEGCFLMEDAFGWKRCR